MGNPSETRSNGSSSAMVVNYSSPTSTTRLNATTATTIYHKRPYLIYLEFAENCISGASQLVTIPLMGYILYCSLWARHRLRMQDGLSPPMYVYLVTHIAGALLALPYSVYTIGWWSPRLAESGASGPYSPYPLFSTGVLMTTYMSVSSTPVFFVTADRCLVMRVQLHARLGPSASQWIAYACATTVVFVSAIQFYFASWELPLREEAVGWCRGVTCFLRRTLGTPLLLAKDTFAALNFLLSLCLFYQLGQLSSAQAKQLLNRLVKFLMVVELALDIVPVLFLTMFNFIVGDSSGNYFGSVAIPCACVDAAICSVFYYLRLVKRGDDGESSTAMAGAAATGPAISVKRNIKRSLPIINNSKPAVVVAVPAPLFVTTTL